MARKLEFEKTPIEGLFVVRNFQASDDRGCFVKTFNMSLFKENEIEFCSAESYYSKSKLNVIRGMHFQTPPHDHQKLVYVTSGRILDVVVDLRSNSSTYQKCFSIELSENNATSLFLPKGIAHGFLSLSENTTTVYNVSSVYEMNSDSGIRYDSFGFDWGIENPIVSERDQNFMSMDEFCRNNLF